MRKLLLIVLVAPLAFACNQGKIDKLNAEVERLSQEKQVLVADAASKDSSLSEFTTTFTEIEQNLAEIRQRENFIANNYKEGDLKKSSREQVKEDIEAINQLLQKNKELIASLEAKANSSSAKAKKFQGIIANLNRQIAEKDADLARLQTELEEANFTVARLNTSVDSLTTYSNSLATLSEEQKAMIEQQTTDLNTAYVITGTYKELKDKNIITKEGDIIGLGGKKTLVNDFNKDMFKRIDITETTTLPLHTKKANVVTYHQEGSFVLQGDDEVEQLVITNPQDFWKASKYLVVVTN